MQATLVYRIDGLWIKNMLKGPFVNISILTLWMIFAVGCSSFHEVSVVSHGDEVAAVKQAELEEAVVVAPSPPVVDQVPIQVLEAHPPVPIIPFVEPADPVDPPMVSPSEQAFVAPDIFAQSADDSTLPWTLEDVFFDFDQMAIRRDAIPLLEQNAKVLLKRYPKRKVLIQGHCDERGTEAYNFILGERRASAVKNYLVDLGVPASQLRVLSLGKNQPFCLQRTIPCLRLNRRAHFVLK